VSRGWALPAAGDIVWCLFPELPDSKPGPKPRPALVLSVERREDGDVVRVAYGTSQKLNRLRTGEVAITQSQHPAAYALAGLAYDTKFDFKAIVELPWSDRYFKALPKSRHGNNPKLGTLHVTVLRAVEAAYRAAVPR
jgi:mRNA-degrading endonuclease toxin of MazEF toxin-antitoxin module